MKQYPNKGIGITTKGNRKTVTLTPKTPGRKKITLTPKAYQTGTINPARVARMTPKSAGKAFMKG